MTKRRFYDIIINNTLRNRFFGAKEAIFMKKLFSAAAAVLMTICMSVSAMAATSNVSVKNNSGTNPVTYTYETGKSGETVKSIKRLMSKLSALPAQDSVVQAITVTSRSADKTPVEFKLRLSLPEKTASNVKPSVVKTPSPTEISSLDYYNIKVTDTKGNVLYSEEEETEDGGEQTEYRDIPLGVMNSDKSSENKIFNIIVSVNKDLNKNSIAAAAKTLDWSIVSSAYEEKETQAPASASPSPAVTHKTEEPGTSSIAVFPSAPAVSSSPSAAVTVSPTETEEEPSKGVSEDKSGNVTLSKGEYLCGKDIEPGRYTMTGEGKVHVYTSEGVLKTTIALKNKNDKSANGVDEYVINLREGEKIAVESDTKFTPYTASKSTPKPTSTAKASSTKKPSSNSSNTKSSPSPTSAARKNNPKTGDSAPLIGITALAVLAAGAFTVIEIKKRKQQ